MTTTEQIREALEYAKREAQESGKHFSQSEVDRLNAKEYVRIADRALALLRSMDGQEPEGFSIHSDVRTTDLLLDLHKVIKEFRDPMRAMTFFHPIGGQAVRLAQLHDELDLWLKTTPIHPSPQTGEPRLDVDELANEIRRVDGSHSLGAGALAEALMPFLTKAAK